MQTSRDVPCWLQSLLCTWSGRWVMVMRLEHFDMLFCLPTPACPAPKSPEIIFSLPSSYSIFHPLTDFLGTQKRCLDNSQVIIHASQRNKGKTRGFSTVSDYNWHTSFDNTKLLKPVCLGRCSMSQKRLQSLKVGFISPFASHHQV